MRKNINILSNVVVLCISLMSIYGVVKYFGYPDVYIEKKLLLGYVTDYHVVNDRINVTIYTDQDETYHFESGENSNLNRIKMGDFVEAFIVIKDTYRNFFMYSNYEHAEYIENIGAFNYPEKRFPSFYEKIKKMETENT